MNYASKKNVMEKIASPTQAYFYFGLKKGLSLLIHMNLSWEPFNHNINSAVVVHC